MKLNLFLDKEEFSHRFSISTVVLRDQVSVNEQTLAAISKAGFCGIELLEDPKQFDLADKSSLHDVRKICKSLGLSIISFHAHYLTFDEVNTKVELQNQLEICYRQIDTLEECGGKFWACHLHHTDAIGLNALESLARYVEGRSIDIGVENFVSEGMWVEDRLATLRKLDSPRVGLLLDIGHVRNQKGENPMTLSGEATEVILSTKPFLKHVHLHGFKEGVDHFPPYYPGDEIQWEEIMLGLQEIEYAGFYNFEPKGIPDHSSSIESTGCFYENYSN